MNKKIFFIVLLIGAVLFLTSKITTHASFNASPQQVNAWKVANQTRIRDNWNRDKLKRTAYLTKSINKALQRMHK